MMKAAEIQKRINRIVELEDARQQAEKKADGLWHKRDKYTAEAIKLGGKADQMRECLRAALVRAGIIASVDGVTSEEANLPLLAGIESLFEIGDGWC